MKSLAIKIGTLATVGLLSLQMAVPIFALGEKGRAELAVETNEKAGSRPGLLRNLLGNGRAAIGTGTLTAIGGTTAPTTLTVTKNGTTYTINITANTQLRRRFWGKATLSEFTVGDMVTIIGQWTDSAHTTVNAVLVRDLSIQKRFGVFIGTVSSLTGTGWVMSTLSRGNQTVTVSTTTKLVNRKGQTISQADVKVNDRVRVRGLWDSKANTITEVTNVKDYTIPVK